jgi:hypothetical protein
VKAAAAATNGDSEGVSLRPPLKWAGGKRWLVPRILALWEQAGRPRLVELLCGGLAIALAPIAYRAVLNDINPHNINFASGRRLFDTGDSHNRSPR